MAVIYGWAYAVFHANVGWEHGAEPEYNYWENHWAHLIESYVFYNSSDAPLVDAGDINDVATLVNRMMVETNIFIKGDAITGGYITTPITFPKFKGNADDNGGLGSGDYVMLNKIRDKYNVEGVELLWSLKGYPDTKSFGSHGLWY